MRPAESAAHVTHRLVLRLLRLRDQRVLGAATKRVRAAWTRLGIDPIGLTFHEFSGRPISVLNGGKPIAGLVGRD